MSLDWLITLLVALIAATPGVYALYVQNKKNKLENIRVIKADEIKDKDVSAMVAKKYAELAITSADRVQAIEGRVDTLEAENKLLCEKIETLEGEIKRKDLQIVALESEIQGLRVVLEEREVLLSELQIGVEKLIAQLIKRNILPEWKPPLAKNSAKLRGTK